MITKLGVPRRSEKTASRTIDNETVVIALETQESIVLNEVGSRIWQEIDGNKTIEEIAVLIAGEFEVSAEQALADTCEFTEAMMEKGIACV